MGILLTASLIWFLSFPVRERILIRGINKILAVNGDSQFITGPLSVEKLPSRNASRLGSWFLLAEASDGRPDRLLVFSFMADGFFFPCAAVLSPEDTVKRLIPLNPHGEKLLNYLPPGVIAFYIQRIEKGLNPPIGGGQGGV